MPDTDFHANPDVAGGVCRCRIRGTGRPGVGASQRGCRMLLTQRSPFSSPTGSGCSSPFGSPCHSDYSSPRGQMALPAARISPRVQQSSGHQHRSTGHFGGGGAESPPALMSPLRHSKSLPADMHIAGQDEPSAHRQQCQQSQQQMGSMDPAPICRASSLQPPPRRCVVEAAELRQSSRR